MDFKSIDGLIAAIQNPNNSVKYIAWMGLHNRQNDAKPALLKLAQHQNPRMRARALWLLSQIENNQAAAVALATKDKDDNIRGMALRLARQHKLDVLPLIREFADDDSALVRRECLIALRHHQSDEAPALWAKLANAHDGKDRWYLEALGLAADKQASLLAVFGQAPDGTPVRWAVLCADDRDKDALSAAIARACDANALRVQGDRSAAHALRGWLLSDGRQDAHATPARSQDAGRSDAL